MRIWLLLLSVIASDAIAQPDVIVHKVGRGYLYVFPHTISNVNPAGVINVGSTITVMYSLRLIGTARARFIAMDATRTRGITPNLTVMKHTTKSFGFFIRDTNQKVLDIAIDPSFMRKIEKLNEKQIVNAVAAQGNLNVLLRERGNTIIIERVSLE